MGLLEYFRKDPTTVWPAVTPRSLSLRIPSASVNGVVLYESYEELAQFGRPSNRSPLRDGRFVYLPLGFEIGVADDVVDSFGFVFRDDHREGFEEAHLRVELEHGGGCELRAGTREAELVDAFGPPELLDDGFERILRYRFGSVVLEFELTRDARLRYLSVFRDALVS